MTEKTAIVLSGGAMRCAYNSGALLALERHFKFTTPDIMVAASGSVPAMLYYMSGQYRNIEKLWTQIITDNKKVLSMRQLPMLNIDYLIDTVSKTYLPLDLEALQNTEIQYFIPLREAETGTLEYINNANQYNMYEVVRAAIAVPIAYGKKVLLGEKQYIDGFYGLTIETLINKAIAEGATKVIAVNCCREWGNLQTYIETREFKRKFKIENNHFYEKISEHKGVEIIRITPSYKLPTSFWEVDKNDMIESFYMGYQNISINKEVIEMLNYRKVGWLI